MADIRIRVGAALDGSPSVVFKSLGDMARKARAQVATELNRVGEPLGVSVKANAVKAERAMASLRAKVGGGDLMNPATRSIKEFGDEASKRFEATKRRFKELSGEVTKGAKEIERAEKQAARAAAVAARRDERESARSSAAFRRGAGRTGMAIARGALNFGTRVAGDVMSGAGVDFDLASLVRKNVDIEKRATDLANSGYMVGAAGANGQRQDPNAIIAQARRVADATGYGTGDALEGLQSFVGKTGDLETGRAVLQDLAVLSKATGTNLEDMVDAAGDVANGLGDIPNRAAVIQQVMQSIAGQGKLGAVEIKDMATQMAKLAANAGQIAGDPAQNIALLGALAQEARQRGGASSATMAATSVASFMNTLKTPARAKEFEKATGRKVFNAQGMIRDPQELIMEALRAKGMDPEGFKKIFANVGGARATEGFATIYRQAGGGQAGEAAVAAEFERLKSAAMGQGETMESFRRSMETTESRVQVFNNQLQDTAHELQASLAEPLQSLAPLFLALVKSGTSFLSDVLGFKAKKADQEEAGVQLRTLNETSRLKGALIESTMMDQDASGAFHSRTGTIAPTLLAASGEDEVALQKAIDAKMAAVQKGRADLGITGDLRLGGPATEEQIRSKAKAGDGTATDYLRDTEELSRMKEQLNELHSARNGVVEALLSGRVKVQVESMPTPPPKADSSGRQNVAGP
jgi:hypothetical protein